MTKPTEFRGKRKDNNEWIYGYYYATRANTGDKIDIHRIVFDKDGDSLVADVHQESLGEFTGYYSYSNVKIYQGDILTRDEYPYLDGDKQNYVATVEWIFGAWQIVLKCVNADKGGISDGINDYLDENGMITQDYEILGNIHDNIELLKAK